MEISYKIEAELFAGAKVSRVFFKGVNDPNHNHEINGTLRLTMFNKDRDNADAIRRREHIVYINVSTHALLSVHVRQLAAFEQYAVMFVSLMLFVRFNYFIVRVCCLVVCTSLRTKIFSILFTSNLHIVLHLNLRQQ